MESSNTPGFLTFEGLALSHIREFLGGVMAISVVSYEDLHKKICPADGEICIAMTSEDIRTSEISSFMRSVRWWQITACVVETEPGVTKWSFRSGSKNIYDVSRIVAPLGGGGHMFAAGLVLKAPLKEAIEQVVGKTKELYNL
jgi:nanoRNase/pAp phosphatase (c-di-AMP/oligoRNAs hydrolase)